MKASLVINFASSTKRQKCLKNENQKASRTHHPIMLENVKKARLKKHGRVWRVPAETRAD